MKPSTPNANATKIGINATRGPSVSISCSPSTMEAENPKAPNQVRHRQSMFSFTDRFIFFLSEP
jgi:hypothetical protein